MTERSARSKVLINYVALRGGLDGGGGGDSYLFSISGLSPSSPADTVIKWCK